MNLATTQPIAPPLETTTLTLPQPSTPLPHNTGLQIFLLCNRFPLRRSSPSSSSMMMEANGGCRAHLKYDSLTLGEEHETWERRKYHCGEIISLIFYYHFVYITAITSLESGPGGKNNSSITFWSLERNGEDC